MKKSEFKSTHSLDFEIADWPFDPNYKRFRVGTCEGLYGVIDSSYGILAIKNNNPGNGHLQDVFEWFEHSCKRDKKALMVLEVWNEKFKEHLIEKRGFRKFIDNNLIKTWKKD